VNRSDIDVGAFGLPRADDPVRPQPGHDLFEPRAPDQFDPRARCFKLRGKRFPDGKYPASALITVSHFARPGILIEIQGIAVVAE
jgi:hypothetical protein